MQKSILEKLEEMSKKYDHTFMLAMEEPEFRKYFAMIYGELNLFYKNNNSISQIEAINIIDTAYKLLKTALNDHITRSLQTSEAVVRIFTATRELLLNLMQKHLSINETVYRDFVTRELDVRALRACGIPLYQDPLPQPASRWSRQTEDREALEYASRDVKRFAILVSDAVRGHFDISAKLSDLHYQRSMTLYKNVKELHTEFTLIGNQDTA